ncbi:hypothetical protein [Halalkalicoccus ordinarius]
MANGQWEFVLGLEISVRGVQVLHVDLTAPLECVAGTFARRIQN